jgi:hypothetical protein
MNESVIRGQSAGRTESNWNANDGKMPDELQKLFFFSKRASESGIASFGSIK